MGTKGAFACGDLILMKKENIPLGSFHMNRKLLGARYGGGGAVSLEKNRACQLGLGIGFTPTRNVQTSVAHFSVTFCLKKENCC